MNESGAFSGAIVNSSTEAFVRVFHCEDEIVGSSHVGWFNVAISAWARNDAPSNDPVDLLRRVFGALATTS